MKTFLLIIFSSIFTLSIGQNDGSRTAHFNLNKNNVVIDGYDPVSYFNGRPQQGIEAISVEYRGVIYWFASEANKAKFNKNPVKFEPQYGGWCAYALGLEPQKVKIDPKTYKIVDGKLYLFYNFGLTNTLKTWNKEELILLPKADKNWTEIIE